MAVKRAGFLEVFEAALVRLRDEPLPALLVVAGEDAFLKERLLTAIPGDEPEAFARRPDESDADAFLRLLDAWTTASLFEAGRVIVAREAESLLGVQAATRTKRLGELAAVLAAGAPPNRLVLTLAALDGRSKLAKGLKEAGGLVSLPVLRDAPPPWQDDGGDADTELEQWLRAEARRFGWGLDRAASRELTRRVGNEPAALLRKLGQLAELGEGRQSIAVDHVRAHVQHTSARLLSLYEDGLRRRDLPEALSLLERMQERGVYDHNQRLVSGPEADDMILRGLVSNLARLVEAHDRLGPDLVASLRRPPWERSQAQTARLTEVLGGGGRRVFVERDLRAIGPTPARAAFSVALGALRDLRDGRGQSMHATTVRLGRALGSAS